MALNRDQHRTHALTKASATHLLNQGHLDKGEHREIVRHAEKGMKAAKRGGERKERD